MLCSEEYKSPYSAEYNYLSSEEYDSLHSKEYNSLNSENTIIYVEQNTILYVVRKMVVWIVMQMLHCLVCSRKNPSQTYNISSLGGGALGLKLKDKMHHIIIICTCELNDYFFIDLYVVGL